MKKTIFPLLLIIALAANGQLLNVQSIEPLNIQQQENLTTQAVAISPRGDYVLLSTDTKQGLVKWDLTTSTATTLTDDEGAGSDVRISDDGQQIVYGEVVYKDNAGAICRCFNWRESVRTMLTEDTTNAFMIIETVAGERDDVMDQALEEMKAMIEQDLGGIVTKHIADAANPEVIIVE